MRGMQAQRRYEDVSSLEGRDPELMALVEVLGWLVDIMISDATRRDDSTIPLMAVSHNQL